MGSNEQFMETNEQIFEDLSDELFQPILEEELTAFKGQLTTQTCPTVTPKSDNHNDTDADNP